MARPDRKRLVQSGCAVCANVSGLRDSIPGQDGDPHGPILISPAASSAIGINRVSDRRSTVRPSLTHPWQTLWAACVASESVREVIRIPGEGLGLDSCAVAKRVGWCAMSRGGRPWRELLVI